jgi:H+/Cl- antiporter ClcA
MKSILSGTVMNRYLSFKTFIGKVMGQMAGLGTGLSIGKEGNISPCIAFLLLRFPLFRKIAQVHIVVF